MKRLQEELGDELKGCSTHHIGVMGMTPSCTETSVCYCCIRNR